MLLSEWKKLGRAHKTPQSNIFNCSKFNINISKLLLTEWRSMVRACGIPQSSIF